MPSAASPPTATSGDSPRTWLQGARPRVSEVELFVHSGPIAWNGAYLGSDGTAAAIRLLRRLLPRDGARRGADCDLPRRRRPPPLPRAPRHRRPEARLAHACRLPHDEPLPLGDRGNGRAAVGRLPAAQRTLRPGLQCTPRPVGSSLRRAILERRDRGRRRARRRLPVRDREPRPRGTVPPRRRLAVERLAIRAARRRPRGSRSRGRPAQSRR